MRTADDGGLVEINIGVRLFTVGTLQASNISIIDRCPVVPQIGGFDSLDDCLRNIYIIIRHAEVAFIMFSPGRCRHICIRGGAERQPRTSGCRSYVRGRRSRYFGIVRFNGSSENNQFGSAFNSFPIPFLTSSGGNVRPLA